MAMPELLGRATDPDAAPEDRLRAFEEIVRRFQDMVYGYAYAVLGDSHLAQDAAAFIIVIYKDFTAALLVETEHDVHLVRPLGKDPCQLLSLKEIRQLVSSAHQTPRISKKQL